MVFKHNKVIMLYVILIIILLILVVSNVYFINKLSNQQDEGYITEEYVYEKIEGSYDKNKEYYKRIKYSKFKKYLKSDKERVIAVLDNSSNTYNKFLEVINKIAYYRRINIYLLETSKLSNKDVIAFYNIDERFKELNSNYIMVVRNNKILSITTFNNEYLNKFEEGIGE